MRVQKPLLMVWICSAALLAGMAIPRVLLGQKTEVAPHAAPGANPASPQAMPGAPMSDDDKANELSDQVGKLMVKCVNLLTAGDPLSLDLCKQQRDLADEYPPNSHWVERVMAHDEYGIALAAFDRKSEALEEFDQEIALLPKAMKVGSQEWGTAYWHRAMVYSQMGQGDRADRDYRAAEDSYRKYERDEGAGHTSNKMRIVLRQHAALLKQEGKMEMAQKLLDEAAK